MAAPLQATQVLLCLLDLKTAIDVESVGKHILPGYRQGNVSSSNKACVDRWLAITRTLHKLSTPDDAVCACGLSRSIIIIVIIICEHTVDIGIHLGAVVLILRDGTPATGWYLHGSRCIRLCRRLCGLCPDAVHIELLTGSPPFVTRRRRPFGIDCEWLYGLSRRAWSAITRRTHACHLSIRNTLPYRSRDWCRVCGCRLVLDELITLVRAPVSRTCLLLVDCRVAVCLCLDGCPFLDEFVACHVARRHCCHAVWRA